MSIPTFAEMRDRLLPIWQDKEYARDILWAGIFGSVARNRAHSDSDVDVLIVLKAHERGEPVDLRERPDWAWGHVRLEALLSSRTVYGNRRDVEHLRLQAMTFLQDGLARLDAIAEAVERIKRQVGGIRTYENFIEPAQAPARRECIQALGRITTLLDIQPLHHPIRTMLVILAFESADRVRTLLADVDERPIAPVWRKVWDHVQPTSITMWAFDAGCAVGGRSYIRHILASKRLADTFEEGGVVDDSMYAEIVR